MYLGVCSPLSLLLRPGVGHHSVEMVYGGAEGHRTRREAVIPERNQQERSMAADQNNIESLLRYDIF